MKKAGYIVLLITLLLIINGLLRSIYDLWQKQDLLTDAKTQLDKEKLKNTKLKAGLSYVQTERFVDETARNKLFLAKPGEQQIIIPQGIISFEKKDQEKEALQNWQKWLKLLF